MQQGTWFALEDLYGRYYSAARGGVGRSSPDADADVDADVDADADANTNEEGEAR